MQKIHQYIPLHLSIFLALGIILGSYFSVSVIGLFGILAFFILLLWVFHSRIAKSQKLIFQIIGYLSILCIGWLLISLQNPKNQTRHFSKKYTKNSIISIQISEILKPTLYQDKYIAAVQSIDNQIAKGNIILNITKDSIHPQMEIGASFVTHLSLKEISKPLNPHTFDYASYMQKKGVFHQANGSYTDLKKIPSDDSNPFILAGKTRKEIQNKLFQYPFGKNEIGIINALLLGDKKFISKDLQGNYAAAGAVHILAVSGLHVGIIFLILSFLFKPILRFKNGKNYVGVGIILLLWCFALIAGMSGSVTRAVTMFSFITIGMFLKGRKSPVLHSLFASFFILLLINPSFLFDVGFQLSYAAVLGIVLLQPKIVALIPKIKWKLIQYLWQLMGVSIAATLATLPLSLYYFHQFPGLFVLSNLVIIPFIGVILGLGLLVVTLAVLNILPNFLVWIYDTLLQWMNFFIEWIAQQEKFLITDIPFSLPMMLMGYLVLALGYRWFVDKRLPKFQTFVISALLFQSVYFIEKHTSENKNEMVVFHKSKESIIGFKTATTFHVFHSKDSMNTKSNLFLRNYKTAENIDSVQFHQLETNVLIVDNYPILLLDSIGIYQNIRFKPNYFLLTQSSKINLDRLIEQHHPQMIIADGSNYPYLVEKWKNTCAKNKIPFHYTGEKGAFQMKF